MPVFIECNLCKGLGKFQDSKDIRKIHPKLKKFHSEEFTVWRCPSCNSLHSKEDVDLSRYYEDYPLHGQKPSFYLDRAHNVRLRRLKKYGLNKEQQILDFGCGNGNFLSFLKRTGFNYVRGFDAYHPHFSSREPLKQRYDCIVCQDVIEHVDDPKKLFLELTQYLKPGGILSIGTPNADNMNLSEPEKCMCQLHQPHHRHIFSEKALLDMGTDGGLDVVGVYHRSYFDTFLPFFNWRYFNELSEANGNLTDPSYEGFNLAQNLLNYKLLFFGFFGYFFPRFDAMEVIFRAR